MTKKDEELIRIFERKIMRKIYGSMTAHGEYAQTTN